MRVARNMRARGHAVIPQCVTNDDGLRVVLRALLITSVIALGFGCSQADPVDLELKLEVTGLPLPTGRIGFPYDASLRLVGAEPTGLDWKVRGAFPGGLSFTPQLDGSARIAGIPTEAGQFELPLVVLATDGRAVEALVSLEIRDATPLTITTAMLPSARVGSAYAAAIDAQGGTDEGHVWTVDADALPPGLTLESNGPRAELVGAPAAEGMFVFAIEVRDSAGTRAARALSLFVEPATDGFRVRLPEPPGGIVGEPLDLVFEGENGQSPLMWRFGGAEIPGMAFEASASRIARLVGTPTTVGRYSISISVVDTDGLSATAAPTIIIAEPLIIEATTVRAGTVGAPYEHRITASEAGGDHRWTVTRGALPSGLSLTGEGRAARLAGVPTSTGSFQFTAEVLDRIGQRAEIEVELLVADPLSIVPPVFSTLVLGTPFASNITAIGGRAPYAFEIATGALPAGLILENASARIAGIAGEVGTFSFTIAVEDIDGRRATHAASLTIVPSGVPLTVLVPSVTPFRTCVGGHVVLETQGGSRFGHTWSVDGVLPAGLWLPTTGTPTTALGGVPRVPGVYSVGVRVEDSNGEQASQRFSIEVLPNDAPRWATVDNARASGLDAVLLVDLCDVQPRAEQVWSETNDVEMSPDGRWLAVPHRSTSTGAATLNILDLFADPPIVYVADNAEDGYDDQFLFGAGPTISYVGFRIEETAVFRMVVKQIDLSSGAPASPRTLLVGGDNINVDLRGLSHDANWIAFRSQTDELKLLSASGGAATDIPGSSRLIGFDASDRWMLYREEVVRGRDAIRAWPVGTGSAGSPRDIAPAVIDQRLTLVPGDTHAIFELNVNPGVPLQIYTFPASGPQFESVVAGTEICSNNTPLPGGRWMICTSTQGVMAGDLTGPHGLVPIAPPPPRTGGFSPDGSRIWLQVELDPTRGTETAIYDVAEFPNPTPRVLTPSPSRNEIGSVVFSPSANRVLVLGANGGATAVHDLPRLPGRSEIWRGPTGTIRDSAAWRADESGAFVNVQGVPHWLDLTVPGHPRVVPIVLPPGVSFAGTQNLQHKLHVQPPR